MSEEVFGEWVVIELLGHRRLAGWLTEIQRAGHGFLRLDIPAVDGDGFSATQVINPTSVYEYTPVTEEMARAVARRNQPTPVHQFEIAPPAPRQPREYDRDDVEPGAFEWGGR